MIELELNLFAGEKAKADGIALVVSNNVAWKDAVRAIILAMPPGEFTNDDVRMACRKAGVPDPKHPNAWGAMISGIASSGEIQRIGFRKSKLESTHARIVGVWRKLK